MGYSLPNEVVIIGSLDSLINLFTDQHNSPVGACREQRPEDGNVVMYIFNGLVQSCSISSALGIEILQSCTKLSTYYAELCS